MIKSNYKEVSGVRTMKSKELIILLLCLSVIVTGCSYKTNYNIVDTDQLTKMSTPLDIPKSNSDEVVVRNGVVIYKDKTNSKLPSGYKEKQVSSGANGVAFGPQEPSFVPKSLNIKDNN